MRPIRSLLVVGVMTLLLVSPAAATDRQELDLEEIVQALELILADLDGVRDPDAQPIVRKYDGGLVTVSIPLSEEAVERFRAKSLRDLNILAAGHSRQQFGDFAATVNAVLATLGREYNFWWAAVNLGGDVRKKTTSIISGPGPTVRRNNNVRYDTSALIAASLAESPLNAAGQWKHQVKIKQGGNVKYWFWAQ